MSDFVHLHLHTEYSLLDGAVRLTQQNPAPKDDDPNKTETINPLVNALKARGMDTVAITDHGNIYAAYVFVQTMRKAGLKPIIGEEFYVADDMYAKTPEVLRQRYHLILLAKNQKGYENLMKLSSLAFTDGFYLKPRIDLKHIAEYSEGLICLSACLIGQVPHMILQGDIKGAKELAIKMRDMFAPGDFYIELQDHHLEEDKIVMNPLCQIAKEIGVKVVATNDVHYIEKSDADMQDTMMCITLGCKKNEQNAARFSNDEFYLKSGEEMEELFSWCPEAISSTREIANKIEDYFVLEHAPFIPRYTNDEMGDRDEAQYLRDLAYEGLYKKYPEVTDAIKERLEYELGVIHKCGYDGYFLIVWDYVHEAQKMDIPVGPGRGSGVGSIVAYTIGITDVDPLRYALLFERFLNVERVSMPDFDIDFCFVRRQEVIDYCVKKYGKDNVSQIIAYSTMSARAVVKDVARVMDVSYQDSAAWVKTMPKVKCLIKQCFMEESSAYSPDFKELYESNLEAKRVIDLAIALEGMPRQTSMHAAGVVIGADPVSNHCALSRNGEAITTQFDKNVVEHIGLLKMDFLGLKTLTDIDEAIKLIKKDRGIDIDFHKLGYEDAKVYKLIGSGDCEAVFQLESGGMKKFMAQLQPDNLEDVMAGISLYRPGPMQFTGEFLQGKRNPAGVTYAHPLLKSVLENTYGCIVYQEQVMQIAQKVAGYSFGAADIMRRAVAKKKKDVLEQQRDTFINGGTLAGDKTGKYIVGAKANGVSEEIANRLFDQILKFASYAFNKSHACAYTFLTYQTAYLKCYYPTHYIVAVINNRIMNADELKHYLNYLKRTGVKILSPDINKSQEKFSIEGENVRYGLMGIKNVGEKAMEYVLEERKNGPFKDIKDFITRCQEQVNKKMVESLIKGGAFDEFGKSRATLIASYEQIMDAVAADKKNRAFGQMSLFDELIEDDDIKYTEVGEYDKATTLKNEKEVLGMYLSGHPLDDYIGDNNDFNFDTSSIYIDGENEDGEEEKVIDQSLANMPVTFGCIVSNVEIKMTSKAQKFAVGRLEDMSGSIAFSMYATAFEKYSELIKGEEPIIVSGRIDLRDESEAKVTIDKVQLWRKKDYKPETKEEYVNSNGILYIKVDNKEQKEMVDGVLSMYEGDTKCMLQINGKLYELRNTRARICDGLLDKLKNIVGEQFVKYIIKED